MLRPVLIGLALLLAACTSSSPGSVSSLGSGTVHWTYYDSSYTPIRDISDAGGSGQLLTQIMGNPWPLSGSFFTCRKSHRAIVE